jgi:hypothetical protein
MVIQELSCIVCETLVGQRVLAILVLWAGGQADEFSPNNKTTKKKGTEHEEVFCGDSDAGGVLRSAG